MWGSSIYGILLLALVVGGGALYLAATNGYLEDVLDLRQTSAVVPDAEIPQKPVDIPVKRLKKEVKKGLQKSGSSKGKAAQRTQARPKKAPKKKLALAASGSEASSKKTAD